MYKRLRNLREDRNLQQKDIAEYLCCTQVCYSHYEIGKRDIPIDVLIKLAGFYNTSMDYALGVTYVLNRIRKQIRLSEIVINATPRAYNYTRM